MYALNYMYVRKTFFWRKNPAASTCLRKPFLINTSNVGVTPVIHDC